MRGREPERIELVEADIDVRLADAFSDAFAIRDWDFDLVAAYMRLAYGRGYTDRIKDMRAGTNLLTAHGFAAPRET